MKRVSTVHIADVLRESIATEGLDDGLRRSQAIAAWEPLVGGDIASQCGRPFFRGDVYTVRIASPALRNELSMCRSRLAAAINRHIGADIISEIKFIS